MALHVGHGYVEAALAASRSMEASLRDRFRDAYGPVEGDWMVDAMVRRLKAAIASDSPVAASGAPARPGEVA